MQGAPGLELRIQTVHSTGAWLRLLLHHEAEAGLHGLRQSVHLKRKAACHEQHH